MPEVFVSRIDDFAGGDRRETAKRNILGGNADRLFNLKLRSKKLANVA